MLLLPVFAQAVGNPDLQFWRAAGSLRRLGTEYVTGAGAFGLAISPSGRTVVTSNAGPGRNSLTILEKTREEGWEVRQIVAKSPEAEAEFDEDDWKGVFMGLAFPGEKAVYASEGNSGRVSLFEWNSSRRRCHRSESARVR